MGTQIDKANFTDYKPIIIVLGAAVVVLFAIKLFNK